MSWSRKFGWLGFDGSVLSDAAAPDGVAGIINIVFRKETEAGA